MVQCKRNKLSKLLPTTPHLVIWRKRGPQMTFKGISTQLLSAKASAASGPWLSSFMTSGSASPPA